MCFDQCLLTKSRGVRRGGHMRHVPPFGFKLYICAPSFLKSCPQTDKYFYEYSLKFPILVSPELAYWHVQSENLLHFRKGGHSPSVPTPRSVLRTSGAASQRFVKIHISPYEDNRALLPPFLKFLRTPIYAIVLL